MKPGARRITITAAVLGTSVLAVFVVLNWGPVCDHVEAWRFQLRTETLTLEPEPEDPGWIEGLKAREEATDEDALDTAALPQALANSSGKSVIVDSERRWEWEPHEIPWGKRDFATATILQAAKEIGLRVFEQRFPRRAYVAIPGEYVPQEATEAPILLIPPIEEKTEVIEFDPPLHKHLREAR